MGAVSCCSSISARASDMAIHGADARVLLPAATPASKNIVTDVSAWKISSSWNILRKKNNCVLQWESGKQELHFGMLGHGQSLSRMSQITRGEAATVDVQKERRPVRIEKMSPPFNVLITGSSKGVGYALAKEFLREGDNVIICSRSGTRLIPSCLERLPEYADKQGVHRDCSVAQPGIVQLHIIGQHYLLLPEVSPEGRVQTALRELVQEFGEQRALGTVVDVRNSSSLEELAKFAQKQLGHIDIWINNAGTNAYMYKPLVDASDDAITEIVETNILGVMLCCRQAIKVMREQPRGGHIFNMDGAGADGNATPRFAAYGATKRSLAQFTKSLQAELQMQGLQNVVVHNLSPGMVTTELLMSGADNRQAKFFINVLAEPADKVARYLVPRIRAVPGDKNTSSKYIRFLTGFKAYTQILARLLFKARKDRHISEDT